MSFGVVYVSIQCISVNFKVCSSSILIVGGVLAALGISVVGYVLSAIRLRSLDRQSREKRKTQENDLSFADMEIS